MNQIRHSLNPVFVIRTTKNILAYMFKIPPQLLHNHLYTTSKSLFNHFAMNLESLIDYLDITRSSLRCLLGIAVIRELPIKNFYIRCWLSYFWLMFFVSKGLGRGLRYQRPLVVYGHQFHHRALMNYPDLFWWNLTRVLPKNPPVPDAHREWHVGSGRCSGHVG